MRKLVFLLLACFAMGCSCAAQAPEDLNKAVSEAQKPSTLEKNLEALTDRVGGRVTGSPAYQQAVDWGQQALRAAGADSVTVETVRDPEAASWGEGKTELDITAPTQFRARAVAFGWSGGLKKPLRTRVVDVGDGTEADFARAGDFKGAIILVHNKLLVTWDDLFAEYMREPSIVAAAEKGGAAAIAFESSRERDLLYRHIESMNGTVSKTPMLIVAREDAERMSRLIAAGTPVEAELTMTNRTRPGLEITNVVGELRGSEAPDEYVVIGAHLDSWELGTGALDDGCNAALVIDVLRALKAAGIRPRRSIRFVLFGGEEQGMLGSHYYVLRHAKELDGIAGTVFFDEGSGRITGFSDGGRKEVADALKPASGVLDIMGAAEFTDDLVVGTDNLDFAFAGVPNLVANQEPANYMPNYHASSDTYDKVDFPQLKRSVALATAVVLALADGRRAPRQTHAQVEATIEQTHVDEQLKAFGAWDRWQNFEQDLKKGVPAH